MKRGPTASSNTLSNDECFFSAGNRSSSAFSSNQELDATRHLTNASFSDEHAFPCFPCVPNRAGVLQSRTRLRESACYMGAGPRGERKRCSRHKLRMLTRETPSALWRKDFFDSCSTVPTSRRPSSTLICPWTEKR